MFHHPARMLLMMLATMFAAVAWRSSHAEPARSPPPPIVWSEAQRQQISDFGREYMRLMVERAQLQKKVEELFDQLEKMKAATNCS